MRGRRMESPSAEVAEREGSGRLSEPAVGYRLRIALLLACYVFTGTIQPILVDYLRMHNAVGRKLLLVPTLCNVLGMAACGVLASASEWSNAHDILRHDRRIRRLLLKGVAVDLISGLLLMAGLMCSGSSVFTVLYNSVPAWTALISRVFLGRRLSTGRLAGVLIVCFGLGLNVLGTQQHANAAGFSPLAALGGSAAILIGSLLHSAMFLLTERAVRSGNSFDRRAITIAPAIWSCLLGSIESIFMTGWVLVTSALIGFRCAPHIDRVVTETWLVSRMRAPRGEGVDEVTSMCVACI